MTLARAIYSSAEIILLDDVLAALDVHTLVPLFFQCSEVSYLFVIRSKWIIEKCFRGDLVKGRTVLLVVISHYHNNVYQKIINLATDSQCYSGQSLGRIRGGGGH